ncbi:MAG: LysM peptidoglycan-binding domain-containing protein [Cyclobacteriaceae bacterium]|nr:LysM peptidoglycan-binding domain-containing protein [Cyclobacteriaceae bacterium]
MRFFAVALFFIGAASYAQTPEVPHKMHFADMTLTIRDDARREIQKDVDALTQHPRYFGIKVERAKTYFPIIEKIFEEERLPDDFKYLVLQESALISDAVSTSNAVGFWQFKDFTALEMGLRVDKDIDERMNIASATRGAARYLKKNNYLFNNWLLALQSYQMGGGGVQRSVGDKYNGVRHMEITSNTYWYIKKYLAHKIAFENSVKGEPQVKVVQYQVQSPKAMNELATELAVDEATLREYNKWARASKIPADKPYVVLIPAGQLTPEFNTLVLASTKPITTEPIQSSPRSIKLEKRDINGIPAMKAVAGETAVGLAERAGIALSDFLKYNEISIDHRVESDTYYFLKRKKTKSDQPTHSVISGDNLWIISQQYGVRMARLKRINKMTASSTLRPGDVVWLIKKKTLQEDTPEPVLSGNEVIVAVEEGAFFGWEVKPKEEISSSAPIINPEKVKTQEMIVPGKTDSVVEGNRDQGEFHLVKQGETLYAISKNYGVGVTDLLSWNDLDISTGIRPGQYLKVKGPLKASEPSRDINTTSEPKVIIHEVKSADTLYSVARQYNVTIKELMDWNKKEDLSLSLGERIKILSR